MYDEGKDGYDAFCHLRIHSRLSRSRYTGKERDSETGLDNFGARYYGSNFGRFMTPDWAARPITVPYAVFGDPQSLNLYGYVRNDPVSQVDADGHDCQAPNLIQNPGTKYCPSSESQCPDPKDNCYPIHLNFNPTFKYPAMEPSNDSSKGGGFWSHFGQHLSNLFHGRSWNYGMRESVTHEILPGDPNQYVQFGTDAAGIAGLAAPEKIAKPLGRVGAALSTANDPSLGNITINVLGLFEGFDAPLAITGAFNDFLDYGFHHNPGRVGDKSEVQPTTVYDETGASESNPALDYCEEMCN